MDCGADPDVHRDFGLHAKERPETKAASSRCTSGPHSISPSPRTFSAKPPPCSPVHLFVCSPAPYFDPVRHRRTGSKYWGSVLHPAHGCILRPNGGPPSGHARPPRPRDCRNHLFYHALCSGIAVVPPLAHLLLYCPLSGKTDLPVGTKPQHYFQSKDQSSDTR